MDKNIQAMQTIKIFLGSSITELYYERLHFSDYLMTYVRPLFQNDGIELELIKSENLDFGVLGRSSQNEIDTLIKKCDISIFLFKTKAGDFQIHEFDIARELQKQKKHDIYVFCFEVPTEEKKQNLIEFQKRLKEEKFCWYACKDINDLEAHFIIGLLNYERQLLRITKPSIVELESETEKNGEALYSNYVQDKQKKEDLREKIHKDIEVLIQQTKTVMANKDETIAARIFKVKELYQKADQWAEATDYDREKYANLLFDYAQFLNKYGLYKDAETIYLRQIPLAEELYGIEHKNTAISYNNIGLVDKRKGDYDKALEYYFKALAIMEKVFGTEHPDTAKSYNNIGTVYN